MIAAGDVAEVIRGVDERGALRFVEAVLSGYQGSADVGQVILDTVALTRERNPGALFCADPVMGDVGRGFYARPGIPEFMRDHVVPALSIPGSERLDTHANASAAESRRAPRRRPRAVLT